MPYTNQNRQIRIRQKSQYGPATIALCVVFGIIYLLESYVDGGGLWKISAQTLGALGGTRPFSPSGKASIGD